jgi:hypothetical protein
LEHSRHGGYWAFQTLTRNHEEGKYQIIDTKTRLSDKAP